jgi:hypothetical protein
MVGDARIPRVVICGGGVAAVETLLALRAHFKVAGLSVGYRLGRASTAPTGDRHTPAYATQCGSVGVDARQCSCSSRAAVRSARTGASALAHRSSLGRSAWLGAGLVVIVLSTFAAPARGGITSPRRPDYPLAGVATIAEELR